MLGRSTTFDNYSVSFDSFRFRFYAAQFSIRSAMPVRKREERRRRFARSFLCSFAGSRAASLWNWSSLLSATSSPFFVANRLVTFGSRPVPPRNPKMCESSGCFGVGWSFE
jgi:hypothetical protein